MSKEREREIVRTYYDSYGWHKDATGQYRDATRWADLRPVVGPFWRKVNLRFAHYFSPGRYFLYAGSGTGGSATQLAYSDRFVRPVCVDISHTALEAARTRIGDRGWYVQGDLARLPFRDGVFDATLSPFVLFHLPRDDQRNALLELYRTLSDPGVCVVIYMANFGGLSRFLRVPHRVRRFGAHMLERIRPSRRSATPAGEGSDSNGNATPPLLYAYSHGRKWFQHTLPREWNVDIRCYTMVDQSFSMRYVPDNLVGRCTLRLIFWLESTFPHALAWVGYQAIVIRKRA